MEETKFQEVIWDDGEREKLKNCILVYFSIYTTLFIVQTQPNSLLIYYRE
jgi:hypothetical protein